MLGWIAKKFTMSEINSDLKGLSELPPVSMLTASVGAISVIGTAVDLYNEGGSLEEIQSSLANIRREKVSQASGYNDPVHIIGSLPDHFFTSLSPKFSKEESIERANLIFNTLKAVIENYAFQELPTKEAFEIGSKVKDIERKLAKLGWIR